MSFCIWLILLGIGWFYLIPRAALAQDRKNAEGVKRTQSGPNDPTGTRTGDASTVLEYATPPDPKDPDYPRKLREYEEYRLRADRDPVIVRLANILGHHRVAINIVWTLIAGFLVMFMQAGFALVETGLTRAKNVAHTMAMNFMIYPLGMLGFYVCGFAFMFGGTGSIGQLGGTGVLDRMLKIGGPDGWGILGTKGFFLSGTSYDVAVYALFFFQMVFMDTAATIPTGACAERWKFSAFMLYGLAVGTIIYPIYGNWVWGGGWCSQLGAKWGLGHGTVDFAGSSVVHLQGGIIAAVFATKLGPRLGKYNRDGTVNPIPAHNIPMVVLGTFILAFGWFGFNAGSSLAGTDLRIAVSVVNTMLSSATGAVAASLWVWRKWGKPEPTMMCNGMLAGLVAITAPCAFVTSIGACVIGLVAGILVVESVVFVERRLRIDDPVGAVSVHGVNGLWGALAVGLFADGTYGDGLNSVSGFGVRGLFYHGGAGQLAAQAIGVFSCLVYVSIVSILVYKGIGALVGHRVGKEIEYEGLDLAEMGVAGYNGVIMDKASESPLTR
jgi:Amt family ammonium transporter